MKDLNLSLSEYSLFGSILTIGVMIGAIMSGRIADFLGRKAAMGVSDIFCVAGWLGIFFSEVQDVEGVELCGTLKNVVAIAAGLVDGLDMGNNTKAAVMRIGLREMRAFSKLMFPSVRDNTFFESCGVADLITTCLGGRNRRVAEAFARNGGKRSFDELEAELLKGQKLQGVSTAKEVYEVLSHRGWQALFPLFTTVHEISVGNLPPNAIVEYSEHTPMFSLVEDWILQRMFFIENKQMMESVLESMIGKHGVSPEARKSIATRMAELLKECNE
ncbi:hypothetical protein ACLOJK_035884 [Asimina triloba]